MANCHHAQPKPAWSGQAVRHGQNQTVLNLEALPLKAQQNMVRLHPPRDRLKTNQERVLPARPCLTLQASTVGPSGAYA